MPYFCYKCGGFVRPDENNGEIVCPDCNDTFIEEINDDEEPDLGDGLAQPQVDGPASLLELINTLLPTHVGDPNLHNPLLPPTPPVTQTNTPQSTETNGATDPTQTSTNQTQNAPNTQNGTGNEYTPFSFVFDTMDPMTNFQSPTAQAAGTMPFGGLLEALAQMSMPNQMLFANPEDYAWGPGGLDAVLTQMMDRLEDGGAPPCSQQTVESLKPFQITNEQVESNADCTICQEVFKLDEENVVVLPCGHFFHKECISPWLRLHNACPTCRKPVEPVAESSQQNPLGGLWPPATGNSANPSATNNRRGNNDEEDPDPSVLDRTGNMYG